MKYIFCTLFFFISLSSLYSCTGNNSQTISAQNKDSLLVIKRFDKSLYNYLESNSDQQVESLKTDYEDFLKAFGSVTINESDFNQPEFFSSLKKYFSNEILSQIYKDALNTFSSVEIYENELAEANELIQQHWLDKQLPKLCMHVSGFKANTIVLENLISISADKYLGEDYPLYDQFFEEYQRVQMSSKMIVRDYLKAWLIGELPKTNKRNDLLSEMINQGKILYALQQLLPNWTINDLIGYTEPQIDWAEKNEKQIWQSTLKHNYLFSTEYIIVTKYMEEAPYTAPISTESPGRLGAWLGWKIIKKYADNTKLGLDAIFSEADTKKILKVSKYNP